MKLVCPYHVYNLEEADEVGGKAMFSPVITKNHGGRKIGIQENNSISNDNDNDNANDNNNDNDK